MMNVKDLHEQLKWERNTNLLSLSIFLCRFSLSVSLDTLLYMNVDLKLQNKFHRQMHYKIGVTYVYNRHVFYTVVITRQSNPPISTFSSLCNEFTSVWSMFVYNMLKVC